VGRWSPMMYGVSQFERELRVCKCLVYTWMYDIAYTTYATVDGSARSEDTLQ